MYYIYYKFWTQPVYVLVWLFGLLTPVSFELGAGYLYVLKNLLRLAATPLPQGYNSTKRPKYLDERRSDVPCVRACVRRRRFEHSNPVAEPVFLFLSNVMISLFGWILRLPALFPLHKLVIDWIHSWTHCYYSWLPRSQPREPNITSSKKTKRFV